MLHGFPNLKAATDCAKAINEHFQIGTSLFIPQDPEPNVGPFVIVPDAPPYPGQDEDAVLGEDDEWDQIVIAKARDFGAAYAVRINEFTQEPKVTPIRRH